MSFVERLYHEISRDMLTTLTGGIAGEEHAVSYAPDGSLPDVVLRRRPVQRVSTVSGQIAAADGSLVPFVFGLDDYALAGDAIRFLPFGRQPADKTTLVVNYYPRNAEPTPITDVNVGSVARTFVETVAKELAGVYAQLNLAYDSGFLDTATGASLDRVVALLGLKRLRAGRAVGTVTFSRRPGTLGDVTIPAGTPVTDTQDTVRYETTEPYLMYAGESTAQVRVRGVSEATAVVAGNQLTVIARLVAGLSEVTNERGTTRATDDESDADLRLRASGALTAAHEGTVEALRHGLLQLPEVRSVRIEERPNGINGEIRVTLSLEGGKTAVPQSVLDRIEELRPAGVRVVPSTDVFAIEARVTVTLAGSSLPADDVIALQEKIEKTLTGAVAERGVGDVLRVRPLAALVMNDPRIVDLRLELGPENGPLAESDLAGKPGVAASLVNVEVGFAFEHGPSGAARRDVTASMIVDLIAPTALSTATNAIRTRLEVFLAGLTAGRTITHTQLLDALSNDAQYAIDAITLLVTIGTPGAMTEISALGASYSVGADQSFQLASLQVVDRAALLSAAASATAIPEALA